MKLKEIASILQSNNTNLPDTDIQWLLTDSRSLSFPTETLFFALKTTRNDGHKFIAELYQRQVRCFIVSEKLEEYHQMSDAVFIHVEDTLRALQQLVASYRKKFDIPIIGITGSNGKTVVKEWLYQLLHQDYRIVRSPRSYNSQIGVPLSVWSLSDDTNLGIFEAGISQTHEMERLQPVISPTIGVFTNLGDAHQEGFGGLKQKADEKLKLFTESEVLIYNSDNKLINIAIAQAGLNAKLFSWGNNTDARLRVLSIEKQESTTIQLQYKSDKFKVEIPFIDDASIENALQCVSVMLYLNYSKELISERMSQLEPVAMRLEVKEGNSGCLIINDTYNSDLNSLQIALDYQNRIAEIKQLSRTLILSDILQSGYKPRKLYEEVALMVKQKHINTFIGVGHEIAAHADLFDMETTRFFKSTDELFHSSVLHGLKNELILLKGSRDFYFEQILTRIERQVHETKLDVNLNALVHNFNYFRSFLKPETKTMCMVKAFAYGSGSVEVARTLQSNGCDYLAVAVADEGKELRKEGIRLPIVVMNPEQGGFDTIIEQKLEPEIYSFRLLDAFIHETEKWAITDFPIHIKIDTGMHRLGFNPDDIPKLIKRLKKQSQVKVRSVFSHLVGADSDGFDDFTRQQLDVFTRCADQITTSFSHKIMRHILNSAGVERFPEFQFDMIRLGIGLYSISALAGVALEPVCTLKTVILQIRDVIAGDTVGYSRKGKITQDTKIGVIPIGYADGFNRRLGNGVGEVYVNGSRAPVVGNVCMDLCMIDLTGIHVAEGDEVEVFGNNIPIEEVAEKLNTIPYEVLTSVSRRVKRVYFVD